MKTQGSAKQSASILKKDREIKNITLGGKQLPWVTSAKQLGCKLTNATGALTNDLHQQSKRT